MSARKTRTLGLVGAAAVAILALTGCSAGANTTATDSAASTTPTAAASASASASEKPSETPTPSTPAFTALAAAELSTIFTDIQFLPAEYATPVEMLESIYPGLTVADASCLAPFGAIWDTDATLADSPVEFGTSGDRSMTAVVTSTTDVDAATALVAATAEAVEGCANGGTLIQMQGAPVTTTSESIDMPLTGADESQAWRVSGEVAGTPFTLVGVTARVGGNVVAMVGWKPETNESYVPRATQMFIDKLQ